MALDSRRILILCFMSVTLAAYSTKDLTAHRLAIVNGLILTILPFC